MRKLIPLLTLLALPASTAAQSRPSPATQVARAISADGYLAHVRFLGDDALEGRAPATRGSSERHAGGEAFLNGRAVPSRS